MEKRIDFHYLTKDTFFHRKDYYFYKRSFQKSIITIIVKVCLFSGYIRSFKLVSQLRFVTLYALEGLKEPNYLQILKFKNRLNHNK